MIARTEIAPKILPLTVRAKGVSISTATNWAFNFLVGEATPYLQEVIEWRLYPMHGFFCACSFVLGEWRNNSVKIIFNDSFWPQFTSVRSPFCSFLDTY